MKKTIFAILFMGILASGLFAIGPGVVSRDYYPFLMGANFVLKPAVYTGGDTIAQNDCNAFSNSDADFASIYGVDDAEIGQSNFSVAFQGFLYGAFSKTMGVGADVTYSFQEGYGSSFTNERARYSDCLTRSFTTLELCPHFRYYFANDKFGWAACKIGPNISITGDTTSLTGVGEETYLEDKLQNDVLYGVKAGFDAGLILGSVLMSYDFSVSYDFNPTYNPETTSDWFSENVGNRISFNIGFGYGLKF